MYTNENTQRKPGASKGVNGGWSDDHRLQKMQKIEDQIMIRFECIVEIDTLTAERNT